MSTVAKKFSFCEEAEFSDWGMTGYEPVVPQHEFMCVLKYEESGRNGNILDVKSDLHPSEDAYPRTIGSEYVHINWGEGGCRYKMAWNERIITPHIQPARMLVTGDVDFDKSFRRGLAQRF